MKILSLIDGAPGTASDNHGAAWFDHLSADILVPCIFLGVFGWTG
jgi:hypothetical protein